MSLKMIQGAIDRAAENTGLTYGLTDAAGLILACSDKKLNGFLHEGAHGFLDAETPAQARDGILYRRILIRSRTEYIVYVNGEGEIPRQCLSVLAGSIESIRLSSDEKLDRHSLIRGILMDHVLPGDIILRARELHVQTEGLWHVILVRAGKPVGINLLEVLQSLFPSRQRDFLVLVDDMSTVLVKEYKTSEEAAETERLCAMIVDTVTSELMIRVTVGFGSLADSIREIARSYKEAQLAMMIGGIFESEKSVFNYKQLGIGRLVYQLPKKLCRLFLDEVFRGEEAYIFQPEILNSINQFLASDFNVSEAAKQLYVHRNTLVYRLDKIERDLGLDLRKFNDAVILKFAIMIRKYLDSLEVGNRT